MATAVDFALVAISVVAMVYGLVMVTVAIVQSIYSCTRSWFEFDRSEFRRGKIEGLNVVYYKGYLSKRIRSGVAAPTHERFLMITHLPKQLNDPEVEYFKTQRNLILLDQNYDVDWWKFEAENLNHRGLDGYHTAGQAVLASRDHLVQLRSRSE